MTTRPSIGEADVSDIFLAKLQVRHSTSDSWRPSSQNMDKLRFVIYSSLQWWIWQGSEWRPWISKSKSEFSRSSVDQLQFRTLQIDTNWIGPLGPQRMAIVTNHWPKRSATIPDQPAVHRACMGRRLGHAQHMFGDGHQAVWPYITTYRWGHVFFVYRYVIYIYKCNSYDCWLY